jgi:hypothetical protein
MLMLLMRLNEHETSAAGGTPDDRLKETTQQIDAGFDLVAAREMATRTDVAKTCLIDAGGVAIKVSYHVVLRSRNAFV